MISAIIALERLFCGLQKGFRHRFFVSQTCEKGSRPRFFVSQTCEKEFRPRFFVSQPCEKEFRPRFFVSQICEKEFRPRFFASQTCKKKKRLISMAAHGCEAGNRDGWKANRNRNMTMAGTNTRIPASKGAVWRHRAYPSRRRRQKSPSDLQSAKSPCCDRLSRRCICHQP